MPRPPAIHATAVVAPSVEVGEGTVIGPFAVILGPCTIGADCWIGPSTVIGTTAEHVDEMIVQRAGEADPHTGATPTDADVWFGAHGAGVVIGDRTIVREGASIHSGTTGPTLVGSDVFMMNKSHVAHDNVIGDRARLAPRATLGGHVVIGPDANIGMASAVHQRRRVGAGAMVGMQAAVVHDVLPYQLVKGVPARPGGLNEVGLRRAGFTDDDIDGLARWYRGETPHPPAAFTDTLAAWAAGADPTPA